jgi:hypothetical protein
MIDADYRKNAASYARFVVLGRQRTGSTLIAQALNTNPKIICFGEVFLWIVPDSVGYALPGYDAHSADDAKLRNEDPVAFLQSRIFCRQPETISAVGFKLHYYHCSPPWGFTQLRDHLVEDKGIRVLHVQRRNMLKSLASSKIAESTGQWSNTVGLPPLRSIPKVVIRPVYAMQRAWSILAVRIARAMRFKRVTLSVDECRAYFDETEAAIERFDGLFRDHDKMTLFYEELLSDREEVFARAQSFLGLEPQPVTTSLQKQNPDDLRALLENYEELRQAFADTKYSEFFL